MFREIPKKIVKIGAKFDENCRKIRIFEEIRAKMRKKFDEFCEDFEFGAVRRCANLVDLAKCLKNEYLIAKNGFDTEENEPSKV